MDENEVIEAVCRHLQQNGFVVKQRRHTTEHGVDIIAVDPRSGRTIYIEAKGGTSSRDGSARFGKPYTQTQVYDRVSKGVFTALQLRAQYSDRDAAQVFLAVPDSKWFRRYLDSIGSELSAVGLAVLFVDDAGRVSIAEWRDSLPDPS
jgi:hypothetical protein